MPPIKLGNEFLVNATTSFEQDQHQAVALANGGFVVAYSSGDLYPSGPWRTTFSVKARVFDEGDLFAGTEFELYSEEQQAKYSPGSHLGFELAALNGGWFWIEAGGTRWGYDGAGGFADQGAAMGGGAASTTVATLQDGRTVQVSSDPLVDANGVTHYVINAQILGANGQPEGSGFRVDTEAQGGFRTAAHDPSVTVLADGRFVVVYSDYRNYGLTYPDAHTDISAQIFDPRETAVTLSGTRFGDHYVGTRFDDTMEGRAGDDRLSGGNGHDLLVGNAGDDILTGGAGADRLAGNRGEDVLYGNSGNDRLNGRDGADTLKGGTGDDRLNGGQGKDILAGGDGADKLDGGRGMDRLTGGDGNDRFVFTSLGHSRPGPTERDLIIDFKPGEDKIDLSKIDAVTGGADDAFTFIGTVPFSASAGELRMVKLADHTLVRADVDGDGILDFDIALKGVHDLTASDFFL